MEGWGPDRHNGRGPAWPAPQRSVVLVSSILQTLLPFKAPGNGQFLPTRKCQPAAQFINNSKLSLLTRSPRFFQRGYYLFQVIEHHSIEERFIAILQGDHENVALEVRRFSVKISQYALNLFLLGMYTWGEQPAQPQCFPLFFRKCRSFVQGWIMKEGDAERRRSIRGAVMGRCQKLQVRILSSWYWLLFN